MNATFGILLVVIGAWTAQWITYRIGVSHGKKMAEKQK
jgi:membrane protein DedA with SNARE-associated domain